MWPVCTHICEHIHIHTLILKYYGTTKISSCRDPLEADLGHLVKKPETDSEACLWVYPSRPRP